ncbi:unnamed protein product [Boreogadus saida]
MNYTHAIEWVWEALLFPPAAKRDLCWECNPSYAAHRVDEAHMHHMQYGQHMMQQIEHMQHMCYAQHMQHMQHILTTTLS